MSADSSDLSEKAATDEWQPCKPGCIHLEPHGITECATADEFSCLMGATDCEDGSDG